MSNLLDRSSIVLTPTAFNNGEALCVKPDDGSGDFQFSRNSAATRVNAQGLVENVQILSSNLVQNGDFSEEGVQEVSNGSFSQEGSEELANSNFTNGLTSWNGSGYTVVNNQLITNSSGLFYQVLSLTANKTYKAEINIESISQGGVKFYCQGNQSATITTSGVHTIYIVSGSSNSLVGINPQGTFEAVVNSISFREVGQDWALGTGWSIGEDKAVANTTGNFVNLYQNSVFVVGKTYKTTFTIVDYTQGKVRLTQGGVDVSGYQNAVGTYTTYFTASQTALYMQGSDSFIGSITNISVKEVGMDWEFNSTAILTANGMNITTGGFIRQDVVTIGKSYKLTYDIVSYTSGEIRVYDGTSQGSIPTSVGSNTFNFTAGGSVFYIQSNSVNVNLVITNISVIEITDDTNLPRINYEGFSYQDALGSEEVVNGDFSNGTNNWTPNANATLTIDNNKLKVTISGASGYPSQFVTTEIGKTYKVTADAFIGTSSRLALYNDADGQFRNLYADGSFDFNITATSTSTQLRLYVFDDGSYALWDNVSVKEYLGQEVVPDSGCGSWLFEPQSTNLVTYSEDFSDASWTNEGLGTTPILETGYLAPDGTNNAFKISNANQDSFWYTIPSVIGSSTTRTIYARTTSGTGTAQLCSHNSNTNNTFTITEQWQRFEINAVTSAIGQVSFYAVDFRGSGTLSEIILWGANATNDQDYATSYIPSNGSQVTRNQDVCTNGGSLASINSTEGTLYFEGSALANDGTTRIISLSDGTTANRVNLFFDTSNTLRAFITGVPSIATAAVITDNNKVALKFKSGDISVWLNGTEVATSTSTISLSGLSNLSFNQVGSSPFFGKTKALAVWKEALSDEELTELTSN